VSDVCSPSVSPILSESPTFKIVGSYNGRALNTQKTVISRLNNILKDSFEFISICLFNYISRNPLSYNIFLLYTPLFKSDNSPTYLTRRCPGLHITYASIQIVSRCLVSLLLQLHVMSSRKDLEMIRVQKMSRCLDSRIISNSFVSYIFFKRCIITLKRC